MAVSPTRGAALGVRARATRAPKVALAKFAGKAAARERRRQPKRKREPRGEVMAGVRCQSDIEGPARQVSQAAILYRGMRQAYQWRVERWFSRFAPRTRMLGM